MKRQMWCIVILLTVLLSMSARTQKTSATVEEFSVNGLKVILKRNSANDIISAQLFLRGGALNLTASTQGIETLIFNCAAKGSEKYPKESLNSILDKTASVIATSSTKNYTSISLRCLKSDFDGMWDVYADVIMHPRFVPQDVELVRSTLALDAKQRKDNPDGYLAELMDEVFYAGHPYRFNPSGVESSITGVTIDQMRTYLRENLVTSKLLLVVVGNLTREVLQKKIEATFGMLPKGKYDNTAPHAAIHIASSLKVVKRELPTNYIMGFFSAPGPNDPDYYAMTVTMDILGSRVFEEVRTKRNLSYAPSAQLANQLANYGFVYVTAVAPDTTMKVMLAQVKKLKEEEVSPKDLKDRIVIFLTRYYMRNETNAAQAQFLAYCELSGQGWQAGDKFVDHIQKVSAADVQRVAKKYIRNIQFVVLGNPEIVDQKVFNY